jgi:hypothetical protein
MSKIGGEFIELIAKNKSKATHPVIVQINASRLILSDLKIPRPLMKSILKDRKKGLLIIYPHLHAKNLIIGIHF